MNVIKVITDEDFGLEKKEFNNPRLRLGARGIVLNEKNEIAILYKKFKNEYKLIGGGVESNEKPENTFIREVQEEAGCHIKIIKELGLIEEHKSHDNFKQISHVYLAKVISSDNKFNYTEKEIGEGSQLLWLNLNEALKLIRGSENKLKPSKYDGKMSIYHTKFIVRRDYEILKYYLANLNY